MAEALPQQAAQPDQPKAQWAGVAADAPPSSTGAQWAGVPADSVQPHQAQAAEASGPPMRPSTGDALLMGEEDTRRAIQQGVTPYATSKYLTDDPALKPKLLGKLEQYDWGNGYRDAASGNPLAINMKTDFVARDPESGDLSVYTRTAATDEGRLARIGRAVSPYMLPTALPSAARSVPVAARAAEEVTSGTQAARRAEDVARDIESFDRQDVRKAPIAFSQGPMAGLGQMVASIPFVGSPITRALDVATEGTRNAAQRLAESLSPGATVEQTGQTLQSGLDRFRTAGVRDIEPGQLRELGIQPRAPGNYVGDVSVPQLRPGEVTPSANRVMVAQRDGQVVPLSTFDPQRFMVINDAGAYRLYEQAPSRVAQMSGKAAERAAEAAPIREQLNGGQAQTTRGVPVPAAQPWGQTIMGRRGAADLSDGELQSLVQAPAQDTSFAARAEGLYERARRMVPNFFRADESRNPTRFSAPNTRAALGDIDSQIGSQIGGQAVIGGGLADRLRNTSAHFGMDDLFAMRTEVGRSLGTFGQYAQNLSRTQLKQLYGALSDDIQVALQDAANRAYIGTQRSNNMPNYVQPTMALQADGALRAFRTADRYFRQGVSNMDRFARVAGTDNPQAAVGMLVRSTLDGTKGNLGLLRSAMSALRPDERGQFTSLVINEMGKPLPGVRGVKQELQFSPTSFVTNWNRMDPAARRMMFGGQVANDMNDIVNIASRLSNVESMVNTSKSGMHMIHFLTMIGSSALAFSGHTMLLGAAAAPTAALAFAMSRPSYVRLVAQYARLRASTLDTARGAMSVNPNVGAPQQMATYLAQLQRAAANDPALIPFMRAVQAENGVGQEGDNRKQKQNGARP